MFRRLAVLLAFALLAAPALAQPPSGDQRRAGAATAALGWSLFRTQVTAAPDTNLVLSPWSIELALVMTSAGARGETLTAMQRALGTTELGDAAHSAFGELRTALATPRLGPHADPNGFVMKDAAAVWPHVRIPLEAGFVDVLRRHHSAGVEALDFDDRQAACDRINRWVAEHTENRIPKLLSPSDLSEPTPFVLTAATSLLGRWSKELSKSATADRPFRLANGTVVSVPTMIDDSHRVAGKAAGWTAVDLGFERRDVSMLLLLPDEARRAELEAKLDPEVLERVIATLQPQQVMLELPRFTARSTLKLKDALTAAGMGIAFDRQAADFSALSSARGVFLADVVHEAYIRVDEEGCEAAAATGVIAAGCPPPQEPMVVKLDRPFLWLIQHRPTGAVLFVGKVCDPR